MTLPHPAAIATDRARRAAYLRGYDQGLTDATALYARARAVMTQVEVRALTREIERHPDLDLLRRRVEDAERRHRAGRPQLVVVR